MKKVTIARDASTGKIVSPEHAADNPGTTTVETRPVGVASRIARLEREVEELRVEVERLALRADLDSGRRG